MKAASGNRMCILREPEQYDQLVLGLQNIGKEVALISKKDINVVNVHGDCVANICLYLAWTGGDWKFLVWI